MKVLVVGGNGFLGSAIVKQALSRKWNVISISRRGDAFRTPAGHHPGWVSSKLIEWRSGDALKPETYSDVLEECDAAISTTGILLESSYKQTAFDRNGGNGLGILQGLAKGWGLMGAQNESQSSNPGPSYDTVNRDTAIAVGRTFSATRTSTSKADQNPFIYISAEDIFRPIISPRYIESKREAEQALMQIADEDEKIRPVFLRPGLMYHPQTRPLSTLPAAALDLSSWLHHKHVQSGIPLPTLAGLLNAFPGADLSALARLISLQPLHVDTVAKSACEAVVNPNVRGPLGTQALQDLAGFRSRDRTPTSGLRSGRAWPSQQIQAKDGIHGRNGARMFSTSSSRRSRSSWSSPQEKNSKDSSSVIPISAILAIVAALYGLQHHGKPLYNEIASLTQQEQMRARSKSQGVYAWGSNRYNVVAPDTPLTTFIKSPRSIPYFDGMALRDLQMEERHAVAVDANGDILQWGLGFFDASLENINRAENLDDVPLARRREKEKANELMPKGSLGAQPTSPVRTLKGKDIVKIAASDEKIYALSSKGKVYVFSAVQARQWPGKRPGWSANPFTLFGTLDRTEIDHEVLNATPAAKLARGERIVDIQAGSHHLLSLSNKGRTFSTPIDHDGNVYGQLGLRRVLLGGAKSYREVLMEPKMLTEAEQPTIFHQGQVLPAWALPPGMEDQSKTKKPVTGPENRGIFVREKTKEQNIVEIFPDANGVLPGVGLPSLTSSKDNRPHADIRFCLALHEIPTLRDVRVAQIATGSDHSVVRTTQGKVLGWGRQTHGQTGMGAQIALEAIPVPTEIVLSKAFPNSSVDIHCTNISAGADNTFFTMSRREPGTIGTGLKIDVLAVGKGQWGTLGNAMWNQVTVVPARVKTVSGLLEFSETTQQTHPVPIHTISVGKPGSVAMVLDTVEKEGHQAFGRDVMVFGHNAAFQLGTGKRSNLAVPQHLQPLPPPTEAFGAATPPPLPLYPNESARLKEADINSGVLTHMPHHRLQLASQTKTDTFCARKEDGKEGKKKKANIEETIITGAVSMAIYWQIQDL